MQMLKLIRGIHSQTLRKEFLKEKDPSLEKLLTIATNWQRSADVDKNIETNATDRRTTSTYKKGKNNNWKAKVAQATDPGGTAQGNNKNQEATSKPTKGARKTCNKCSRHPNPQGKACPDLDLNRIN